MKLNEAVRDEVEDFEDVIAKTPKRLLAVIPKFLKRHDEHQKVPDPYRQLGGDCFHLTEDQARSLDVDFDLYKGAIPTFVTSLGILKQVSRESLDYTAFTDFGLRFARYYVKRHG